MKKRLKKHSYLFTFNSILILLYFDTNISIDAPGINANASIPNDTENINILV